MFYCFKGQNASTGNPNKITGRYNMYGEIIAFSTKAKRDRFYEEYRCYGYEFIKKCGRIAARQYCLGMTAQSFDDYMDDVDIDVDEHYNSYFN